MSTGIPLSSLSPGGSSTPPVVSSSSSVSGAMASKSMPMKSQTIVTETSSYVSGGGASYWVWGLILFIFLVIVIGLILWAAQPCGIQKKDAAGNPIGCIDYGKLFLWALGIAFIICIIVWLIRAAAFSSSRC
jgi:cytochrome b subunit of formate dehydrogenase